MSEPREVTLLVVDDDKVDRMAISRALKKQRIANPVAEASNGIEALEILRGEHSDKKIEFPVLVLLDIKMPKMDGLECLRQIRNDKILCNTVVFVMTTSEQNEEKKQAYDLKANGYVTKKAAGPSFLDMISLVESYWKIVAFPE